MSVHAITWAWQQECGTASEKLVLLRLADHAAGPDDEEPGVCWPRLSTVADATGVSPSQVKRIVGKLVANGYVTKLERLRHGDGTLAQWRYRVNYHQSAPALPGAPDQSAPSARPERIQRVNQSAPTRPQEPSLQPPMEPSSTAEASPQRDTAKEADAIQKAWWSWFHEQYGRHPVIGATPRGSVMAFKSVITPFLESGVTVLDVKQAVHALHHRGQPIVRQALERELTRPPSERIQRTTVDALGTLEFDADGNVV